MKKDELVHLHSLFTLLRAEYERRGTASVGTFAAYEDLEVSPMAVYGSKADHLEAVQALSGALAAASESDDEETAGGDRNQRERNATARP